MKTGAFTPKPGDLFTWYNDKNEKVCHSRHSFLSTSMNYYVSMHGINLLVSLTDTDIWWINSRHFYHAFLRDMVYFSVLSDDEDGNEFIHPRCI